MELFTAFVQAYICGLALTVSLVGLWSVLGRDTRCELSTACLGFCLWPVLMFALGMDVADYVMNRKR